ncbi:MAG TPA: hypothetical protein VMA32_18235 [Streptosporangiaceae bacterium]|nr:hypothetical protein [Streptosporangiaceae bacterium]
MAANYLISCKWSLADRFTITDPVGVEQFSAEGRLAFSRRLSVRDTAGAEVAVITRRGAGNRYEIVAGGQLTTVRPRGFFGQRFEITSAAGQLEARGNFTGRQYIVTRAGRQAASVTQLRTFREKFAVDVSDAEDAVLMLAVVLVIETIRDDRRRGAAASAAAGA